MPGVPLVGATVPLKFTTRAFATGVPTTLAGTPAIDIYKNAVTTPSTAGVTLTVDFNSVTGLNHISIDTSADGTFYSSGATFYAVISTGTVDGTNVAGETVGEFTLGAIPADLQTIKGQAVTCSGSVTVNANVGTTQPVNFTGTGASAVVKIYVAPIWDEVNTGATHNIGNSTGRQLRTIAVNTGVIYTATAPSQAGMTSTQIKLDSGASSVNQAYQWTIISITAGTGAGQSAVITDYVGSTRVATIDSPWVLQPDNTSVFEITPTAQVQVISYVAGQDPATLVLDTAASGHNTAGTIGAAINAAGAAGDPWAVNVPGAYTSPEAGYVLGEAFRLLNLINPNSDVIYSSTIPSQSGVPANQVKLDAGASSSNDAYVGDVISATAGTGQGGGICLSYVGATRTATLHRNWPVQPVGGDTVQVTPTGITTVAGYLTGQDPGTLVWATGTRTLTDFGFTVTIGALPSIPNNWITAAGINAGALNGKGDWLTTKTGYSLDLTQAVPTSNTAGTMGDALNAALAMGFGDMVVDASAKTLTIKRGNTTTVKVFDLDSATAPKTRTGQ